MKYIIYAFFVFCFSRVNAQVPVGVPTQKINGWANAWYYVPDSGAVAPKNTPTFTPRFPGTLITYQTIGDTSLMHWTGARWIKIPTTGTDTTPLHNQIILKLNISDTANMLLPYLRKADTANKWVQNIYARNDSLFRQKNGSETFVHTLTTSGSGTVTSVGLSMPSAFNVSPSTITTNGVFGVTAVGTSLQYIRGNGTLATTDTGMIPNFHLKVRSLFTGSSPVTFNQTTGIIGINNANTSGTKGAASFTGAFSDNGSGLIDLLDLGAAGSCTGCALNIDAKGRVTGYSDGTGGATDNSNIGAGFRWLNGITQEIRTAANSPTITWDSASTANALTAKVDTSVIATQYDLTQAIPSWQQTLNVSNTHTSTLYYDTTMVGSPVEKEWANYAPLIKTDTATNAFHQWQYSGTNNGSHNEVMFWGWNVGPGGGNYIAGKPAIGESWESNYQINPDGNSDRLMEKHEIYVTPEGVQDRLSSYTINTRLHTINFYHTVGSFSLYNIATHTPYYSILGTSHNTLQTWINSSDQSDYFGVSAEFAQDANTSSLTVNNGTAKPITLFNLTNFTSAALPSLALTGQGYDGAEISFNGATDGLLSKILSDSSQVLFTSFTNVPMSFAPNSANCLTLRSTRINMFLPTGIGLGITTPIAQLDVRSSTQDQTLYVDNSKAGGYAGIFNATNGSGGNIALDLTAGGGTGNKAISINTGMGTGDWNFYSAGSSKTYFNGKVGLGITSPTARLNIAAGTATANTAPLKLTSGTNLTTPEDGAVEYDGTHFYGTIGSTRYQLDQQGGSVITLYTGDGALGADRNVASGGFTLRLSGANNSDTLMSIINTGTSSTGLYSFGSLFGIDAQGTTTGLRAFGSTTGMTAEGGTNEGAVIKSDAIRGATIQSVPATTNTVQEVIRFERGVNGSPGANGVGGSATFYNKRTDNSSDLSNSLTSKFTNAVAANLTSQFIIAGKNNGSDNTVLTIDGDGSFTTVGKRTIGVTTSAAGTLTLDNSEGYVFNGTTTTWTLPAVSGTTGRIYYIKNIGSGSITVNANGGSSEIYSTSAVNTVTVTAGSALILISNGTYFTTN
jgi:hypothetical protein